MVWLKQMVLNGKYGAVGDFKCGWIFRKEDFFFGKGVFSNVGCHSGLRAFRILGSNKTTEKTGN